MPGCCCSNLVLLKHIPFVVSWFSLLLTVAICPSGYGKLLTDLYLHASGRSWQCKHHCDVSKGVNIVEAVFADTATGVRLSECCCILLLGFEVQCK